MEIIVYINGWIMLSWMHGRASELWIANYLSPFPFPQLPPPRMQGSSALWPPSATRDVNTPVNLPLSAPKVSSQDYVFLPHLSTCRQDAILLQVVTCPLQAHAFSLSNWTGFVQVQCHCVTWTQHDSTIKITLLRVIPTMTFIRFVTDKSSVT